MYMGSRKKSSFLVALRPLAPPPLGLVANFFPYIEKSTFSLVAHPFCPFPLIVARPLRKELILRFPMLEQF